jgi:nicotinate-nucleotide adenylyltransferase
LSAPARPSRSFEGVPPHGAGQRIGLLGGSFNPPHEGHRRISLMALRRLGLDCLWWMVTPGNPLKDVAALPPLAERMRRAAAIAAHPRIVISGAEQVFRTPYTADLIAILKMRAPDVRFVWVMGSDNLAQFHRWEDWHAIARSVPIAVVNRPGFLAAALSARSTWALLRYRVDEQDALALADRDPPAWVFMNGPRSTVSSTALRGSVDPS